MNRYGDAITRVTQATRKGMGRISKMTGLSGNPDLRVYNRMKPVDFERLRQQYGAETVTGYIKDMELARLKEMNNGN
jgi:hypothetical protein